MKSRFTDNWKTRVPPDNHSAAHSGVGRSMGRSRSHFRVAREWVAPTTSSILSHYLSPLPPPPNPRDCWRLISAFETVGVSICDFRDSVSHRMASRAPTSSYSRLGIISGVPLQKFLLPIETVGVSICDFRDSVSHRTASHVFALAIFYSNLKDGLTQGSCRLDQDERST